MTDEFHQHEALHTCHVIMETFDTHVSESAYVQANPALVEVCAEAQKALFDAYQAIGEKT